MSLPALICSVAVFAIGTLTVAQAPVDPRTSPLEAVTVPKADAPVTAVPKPALDPEFERLSAMLIGSFAAPAAGGQSDLRLNTAPIPVAGLDNAIYFELTRADSPADAFRQGVFHLYRFKKDLRLRVFDISATAPLLGVAGTTSIKHSMVALWAAPDALPKLTTTSLTPNFDLTLTPSKPEGSYSGQTPHPFATSQAGAVEATSRIAISPNEISLSDTGLAADGSTVWGGPTPTVFKRSATSPVTIKRTDDGLVILTLAAPATDSPKLVENGTVAVHFTGWLTDGTRFDTSRQPNRQAFSTRIPSGFIRGWNEGLAKIAKGERRRLVIPPEMAFGSRGQRGIPANATLIFDIECVYIDNTVPPEVTQPTTNPAQLVNPHSFQPPARPQPAPNPPATPTETPK